MTDAPRYWLPKWWDWTDCSNCLKYGLGPCASCEIPPGMLALACLVGGGTAVVGGSLSGNVAIASDVQAKAAGRQHGAARVNQQAVDIREVNISVDRNDLDAIGRGHRGNRR